MASERTRWKAARRHLTPVAEGGELIPGAPETTFRTAPLPPGVELKLFEDCGCDYSPPIIDGKPAPQRLDPAWTEWTEDPPKDAGREAGKRALRYALSDPRKRSDGGLLGPNYYGLGHFHSGDARHDAPGYPDLTIWTPYSIPNEVWELKKMGQCPTLPQAHHMTSLEAGGFVVRTVRPCCLLSGWVDRWLARLSGRAPTLSEWAPDMTDADREQARRRAARAAIAGGGPVAQLPGATPTAVRARQLGVAGEAPGKPVDDQAEDGEVVAYLIPSPGGDHARAVADLEGWLRALGFPPYAVPWPMRIVVGERVVVVWVNTGEPGEPGKPRPRTWRSAYLDQPFPQHVIAQLGGDARPAVSLPAGMSLIDAGAPAKPKEPR